MKVSSTSTSLPLPPILSKRLVLHRKAESVEHEPRGLLSDAKVSCNLVGTDSVLAVNQHPHCDKPLVQSDWRILKDSPDLDRELVFCMASLALPPVLVGEEHHVLAPTSGTLDAIRPAQLNHVSEAVPRLGVEDHGLLECLWSFHGVLTSQIVQESPCLVNYIIAELTPF